MNGYDRYSSRMLGTSPSTSTGATTATLTGNFRTTTRQQQCKDHYLQQEYTSYCLQVFLAGESTRGHTKR
eukprot:2206817-Amphidinium_carterae.1